MSMNEINSLEEMSGATAPLPYWVSLEIFTFHRSLLQEHLIVFIHLCIANMSKIS
jgi:hypothetical protein